MTNETRPSLFALDPEREAPAASLSWLLLDETEDRPVSTLATLDEGLLAVAAMDAPLDAIDDADDAPLQGAALDAPDLDGSPLDLDGDPPPPVAAAPDAPTKPDPWSIDTARILQERPDVQQAFYDAYYVSGAYKTPGDWMKLVGGKTADAYALHWYDNHGKFESYNQGPTTAQLNVSIDKILADRPDVLDSFYGSMSHGRHSKEWVQEVGGDTPEAFARYWYQQHGRWEGYAQTEHAAGENIDISRLLKDRPDVVDAWYKAYYNVNNDHNSSAWTDRVGGDTLQDYGKFWYVNYGRKEGYTQNPNAPVAAAPEPSEPAPLPHDPSVDPWNHPAIYPDWQPPYAGWTPPEDNFHGRTDAEATQAIASVGQTLSPGDIL